jgi:hypothetical protein
MRPVALVLPGSQQILRGLLGSSRTRSLPLPIIAIERAVPYTSGPRLCVNGSENKRDEHPSS